MFTGLIEERGEVAGVAPVDSGVRFEVRASFAAAAEIGESIAINGCCLTVVTRGPGRLGFDLLEETRRVTNLGGLQPGTKVNLERSLRADARLGGHFVTGHVDATGEIVVLEPRGGDVYLRVRPPAELMRYVAPKGSIAIDGISLTVAEIDDDGFSIWLIPHTLSVTTLGVSRVGDRVNLEFDLLAKYVERLIAVGVVR